ncbi:hypothetical protein BDV11DRAFT_176450 [Aspergillus similis]
MKGIWSSVRGWSIGSFLWFRHEKRMEPWRLLSRLNSWRMSTVGLCIFLTAHGIPIRHHEIINKAKVRMTWDRSGFGGLCFGFWVQTSSIGSGRV